MAVGRTSLASTIPRPSRERRRSGLVVGGRLASVACGDAPSRVEGRRRFSTDNAEVGGSIPPSPTEQRPPVIRDYVLRGWESETATDRPSPASRQHHRWLNGDSRTARKGREHLEAERDGVNDLPELWDIDRLAGYLSVSKHFVYRLTREHRIRFVRVGKEVRFRPEDVTDWLEAESIPAAVSHPLVGRKKGTAAYS